nr:hypothetical protein Iba_scaffold34299CG0050 [Ipomoea batatas]GMC99954.1 hypothetical protein Iba_scaffold38427CG0010 [Ipomoea batatas]GME15127.1 hypothetical protein Iba_scaffold15931CG0080 [Ipomoea batatas]
MKLSSRKADCSFVRRSFFRPRPFSSSSLARELEEPPLSLSPPSPALSLFPNSPFLKIEKSILNDDAALTISTYSYRKAREGGAANRIDGGEPGTSGEDRAGPAAVHLFLRRRCYSYFPCKTPNRRRFPRRNSCFREGQTAFELGFHYFLLSSKPTPLTILLKKKKMKGVWEWE